MTTIIEDRDTVEAHADADTASLFGGDPARTADDARVQSENAPEASAELAAAFAAVEALDSNITPIVPIDVAEIRNGQAVVSYAATEAILAELRKLYEGKRYDLTIPEQAQEAHDGSRKLMKLRTGLEKLRVAHKAPAIELGTKIDAEAARIKKEIVTLEKAIDDQIEAEKKRLAELAAERARLAEERRLKFEADIVGIRAYVEHAKGLPSDRIERGIELVEAMTFGEEWAEFGSAAALAQVETLKAMRELLTAAQAREKIEAEAAADRARLAQVAETQRIEAERLEKLRESVAIQQAALEKQRAEFEAREAAAEAARLQALRDAEAKAQAEAQAEADARAQAEAADQAQAQAEAAEHAFKTVQIEAEATEFHGAVQAQANAAAAEPDADGPTDLSDDALAAMPSIANQIPAVEPPAAAHAAVSRVLYGDEPIDDQSFTPIRYAAPAPGPITFAEQVPAADDLPPLSIGAINERLRVMSINAATLKALGFEPVPAKGSAVLLAGRDWPALKQSLIAHIEALA